MEARFPFWTQHRACALFGIFLILACSLPGCAPKQRGSSQPPSLSISTPQPKLSAAEEEALHACGELDRKLSAQELKDVEYEYRNYLRLLRKDSACTIFRRSQLYLTHARQIFRSHNMPEELALLAIVESGYNPAAVSRSGAAGHWQFMPPTGRHYGLQQDDWVDERHDPFKSAEAAATYLKKLYKDFHDWHLALAAYNAGEGKISRALEKTGTRNFFDLKAKNYLLTGKDKLKDETLRYVPRFLAICKIVRRAPELGMPNCNVPAPEIARVSVRPGTDLKELARVSGITKEEFQAYNRAHKHRISHMTRPSCIYVPSQKRDAVISYLRQAPVMSFRTCQVTRNDSWYSLSRRTGVSVADLRALNPGELRPGSSIRLPESCALPPSALAAKGRTTSAGSATPPSTDKRSYTIREGDTLRSVADRHQISIPMLQALNGLDQDARLTPGQRLTLPSSASAGEKLTATASRKIYTVQPGDTVWKIARKLQVPPQELLHANSAAASGMLRPGDTLRLP